MTKKVDFKNGRLVVSRGGVTKAEAKKKGRWLGLLEGENHEHPGTDDDALWEVGQGKASAAIGAGSHDHWGAYAEGYLSGYRAGEKKTRKVGGYILRKR